MKLFLIRHGQSEANLNQTYTGQSDVPLTETADSWTWEDGTGNHGTTERIAECWFRYTANF